MNIQTTLSIKSYSDVANVGYAYKKQQAMVANKSETSFENMLLQATSKASKFPVDYVEFSKEALELLAISS